MRTLPGTRLSQRSGRKVAALALRTVLVALAIVPMTFPVGAAVQTSRPSGLISGSVVEAEGGKPVEGAIVSLSRADSAAGGQGRTITESAGRFVFANLPPGRYTITASSAGYFETSYGRENAWAPGRSLIVLGEGGQISGLALALQRPSSISGRVTDERGEPMAQLYVRAIIEAFVAGHRRLIGGPVALTDDRGEYRLGWLARGRYLVMVPSPQAVVMPGATGAALSTQRAADVSTFERAGRYRPIQDLFGEGPARVALAAHAPLPLPGTGLSYPITFYPSARSPQQAVVVEVGANEQRREVNMVMSPVPAVSVSGIVVAPAGTPGNPLLRLVEKGLEDLGYGSETATALVAPDGSFSFPRVPSGDYSLSSPIVVGEVISGLRSGSSPAPPADYGRPPGIVSGPSGGTIPVLSSQVGTQFYGLDTSYKSYGQLSLSVGSEDVRGVALTLRRAAAMRGKIRWETRSDSVTSRPRAFSIFAESPSGEASVGVPRQWLNSTSTEFELSGLLEGKYFLHTSLPTEWAVKSITWNGVDYANVPLDVAGTDDIDGVEIAITDRVAVVEGSVVNGRGEPQANAAVIGFPVEPGQWLNYGANPTRIGFALTSSDGTFRLPTLPAGDYYFAAVSAHSFESWQDEGFLARVAPVASRLVIQWAADTTVRLHLQEPQ